MVIFLSLLTAAVFGTADFCGGLSAQRTIVLRVVAGSHLIGGIGVFFASLAMAERFGWRDFILGMIGGTFGGIAVALLYRGLARGPMAVVAPTTAITSAVVPAIWGVFQGERLTFLAWAGVALALIAIGLISTATDDSGARITFTVVVEALLAGAGFGLFFIFLNETDESTTPWPIFGARLLTSSATMLMLVAGRRLGRLTDRGFVGLSGSTLALIALTGLIDTGSNILFLLATNTGALVLVSVLSSLYPVSTVILARVLLKERMSRLQLTGFATALAATILIGANL